MWTNWYQINGCSEICSIVSNDNDYNVAITASQTIQAFKMWCFHFFVAQLVSAVKSILFDLFKIWIHFSRHLERTGIIAHNHFSIWFEIVADQKPKIALWYRERVRNSVYIANRQKSNVLVSMHCSFNHAYFMCCDCKAKPLVQKVRWLYAACDFCCMLYNFLHVELW